jgi:ribonuclease P protein component
MKATKDILKTLETIKKRAHFVAMNTGGKKWVAESLILQAMPSDTLNPESGKIEIGFTVTKKVGNAVIRNRIKRRLRAAAAEIIAPKAKKGYRYNVIGRLPALTADAEKLRSDLRWCLKRLEQLDT